MPCPGPKILSASIIASCVEGSGKIPTSAYEALAKDIDQQARAYCAAGGAGCVAMHMEAVDPAFIIEPVAGKPGMCSYTVYILVSCGTPPKRWWRILGEAIAEAIGIAVAAYVAIFYGLAIAGAVASKFATDPQLRDNVIQFAKELEKVRKAA